MKHLLIIVAAAFLASCGKSSDYTINGDIKGLADGQAYLMAYSNNGGTTAIDTVEVVNGKFKFSGDLAKPALYYISYSGSPELYTPIFLEKGQISVSGELNNDKNPVAATGTPSNEGYNNYVATMKPLMEQYYAVLDELQQAQIASNQTAIDSINIIIDSWKQNVKNTQKDIIKKNNSLPVAAMVAYEAAMSETSPESITETLVLLDTTLNDNIFVVEMNKMVTAMNAVKVGNPAPDFTLPDTEGKQISLSSMKGKYVLIDFWASWCVPCRNANPHIVALYKEYGSKGLDIVGISLDRDQEAWKKAIKDDNLTWTQLYGTGSNVTDMYGIKAIPHTVLLDKEGVVIAKNPTTEELNAKLKEIFGK